MHSSVRGKNQPIAATSWAHGGPLLVTEWLMGACSKSRDQFYPTHSHWVGSLAGLCKGSRTRKVTKMPRGTNHDGLKKSKEKPPAQPWHESHLRDACTVGRQCCGLLMKLHSKPSISPGTGKVSGRLHSLFFLNPDNPSPQGLLQFYGWAHKSLMAKGILQI